MNSNSCISDTSQLFIGDVLLFVSKSAEKIKHKPILLNSELNDERK